MCGKQDTHREAGAGASPGKKPKDKDGSALEGGEAEEDVDVMIEDGDGTITFKEFIWAFQGWITSDDEDE